VESDAGWIDLDMCVHALSILPEDLVGHAPSRQLLHRSPLRQLALQDAWLSIARSGPSAFGEQINGLGSMLSANRSMRCFRRAPMHAHQFLLSLLLPTTRKGRGSPENELHLRLAVAKHHSLNQCVHFRQLGLLGRHFPTKVPHFGPQGLDFIGLTAPQHHRLPPSLTLRSAPCHNNAASPGLRYG
jgi:hypothetical protein